jgi:hypothetical protein
LPPQRAAADRHQAKEEEDAKGEGKRKEGRITATASSA